MRESADESNNPDWSIKRHIWRCYTPLTNIGGLANEVMLIKTYKALDFLYICRTMSKSRGTIVFLPLQLSNQLPLTFVRPLYGPFHLFSPQFLLEAHFHWYYWTAGSSFSTATATATATAISPGHVSVLVRDLFLIARLVQALGSIIAQICEIAGTLSLPLAILHYGEAHRPQFRQV